MSLVVHPRIHDRHPEIDEEDVREAWSSKYYEALREDSPNFPEYLWIGRDGKGRELEMVGTMTADGWLVYHACTPLSRRTKIEVKRSERRR